MDTPNLMNEAHCPLAFPEYLPALQLAIGVTELKPATSDGSEQPGTPTEVNKVKVRHRAHVVYLYSFCHVVNVVRNPAGLLPRL